MASNETLYNVPFFLNGKECGTGSTFEIKSPATGKVLHTCSNASSEDVTKAIESAATALKTWRKMTPGRRRDIFLKAGEIMERRRDELAQTMAEETGASLMWAGFNINVAIDFFKDVAGRVSAIEGSLPATADEGVGAMILKEPYGVVLAIAPWNAPYILSTRAVLFPLAAGNTVILKASEMSPKTMWGVASCLHEAGLPDGVLNTLVHEPANAAAITAQIVGDPNIKMINFTGSTHVGRIIGKLAAENIKPILLELGGKAPAIVWEDADLELAAGSCALGAFLNAGQICMSTERILVHKNVREQFEKLLVTEIEKIFPPSGDAPILIVPAAVEKNKALVQDAIAKGAGLVTGDPNFVGSTATRLRPIVLNGVTAEMDIYKTESFGPTVSIIEVTTEEEAIRIANDTEYGLSAAVFTENLRVGLRLAKEIETGAVHINSMTVHDESTLPHGGAKSSGFGRFNTSSGIDSFLRTKNITFKY
ncbi:related to aldehyde dehydrogenase [Cephalotrichum gorgonifer]|uniref:Related to aldehyde dehydrogenase n=1 Tax=Cephalotrichum gorgonifer TaxID=2041049 RepID=A0AAE8MZ43_9PEZI|nr:related to aldehyde dehydrogenase [Cephalotrichum gorgonifer]